MIYLQEKTHMKFPLILYLRNLVF